MFADHRRGTRSPQYLLTIIAFSTGNIDLINLVRERLKELAIISPQLIDDGLFEGLKKQLGGSYALLIP
jgi:hypothetical protein